MSARKQIKANGHVPHAITTEFTPATEVYLTRKQLAARWNVHEETVSRTKGLVPKRWNCRRIRYQLSNVLELERGL